MDKLFSRLSGAAMATVIAILSGIGVGSGGLLVIWLTMGEGIDAETARGLNLLFFVFSASAALLIHLLRGRVKIALTALLSLFACLGTLFGTYFGVRVDSFWLKKIFGVFLVLSGGYTLAGTVGGLFKRRKSKKIFARNERNF